jgi:hypothetical protein
MNETVIQYHTKEGREAHLRRAGFELQPDGQSWLLDDEIYAELWDIPCSVGPTGRQYLAQWES